MRLSEQGIQCRPYTINITLARARTLFVLLSFRGGADRNSMGTADAVKNRALGVAPPCARGTAPAYVTPQPFSVRSAFSGATVFMTGTTGSRVSSIFAFDALQIFTSRYTCWHIEAIIVLPGALGFVGSVTLEQLLRTCPDVHKVILLVRSKKGQSGGNFCMRRAIHMPISSPIGSIK